MKKSGPVKIEKHSSINESDSLSSSGGDGTSGSGTSSSTSENDTSSESNDESTTTKMTTTTTTIRRGPDLTGSFASILTSTHITSALLMTQAVRQLASDDVLKSKSGKAMASGTISDKSKKTSPRHVSEESSVQMKKPESERSRDTKSSVDKANQRDKTKQHKSSEKLKSVDHRGLQKNAEKSGKTNDKVEGKENNSHSSHSSMFCSEHKSSKNSTHISRTKKSSASNYWKENKTGRSFREENCLSQQMTNAEKTKPNLNGENDARNHPHEVKAHTRYRKYSENKWLHDVAGSRSRSSSHSEKKPRSRSRSLTRSYNSWRPEYECPRQFQSWNNMRQGGIYM